MGATTRKLNDNEVKTIYVMGSTTNMTYSDLAYLFDVSVNTIHKIMTGQIYYEITKFINLNVIKTTDMDISKHRMVKSYKEKDVVEYYKRHGRSMTHIVEKYNITFNTCKRILLKHKLIEANSKEQKMLRIAELRIKRYMDIVELYHDFTKPVTEIAKQFDVSTHVIYSILDYAMEQGVEVRRRNG